MKHFTSIFFFSHRPRIQQKAGALQKEVYGPPLLKLFQNYNSDNLINETFFNMFWTSLMRVGEW